MINSHVFYPFPNLDDLVDCKGSSHFLTLSNENIAAYDDASVADDSISTWLASTYEGAKHQHAWIRSLPIIDLYRAWRALRDCPERHTLVVLASRTLKKLRQLLAATAQGELGESPHLNSQQQLLTHTRHNPDGAQQQRHIEHEDSCARSKMQINAPSALGLLQEGTKCVCFFAAQLLILAGTSAPADAAPNQNAGLGSMDRSAIEPPTDCGVGGFVRGRRRRGRGGGRSPNSVTGKGGGGRGKSISEAAIRLARPLDPSSNNAWAEALNQAAGCLDDVGQLVWVRGLRFGSAVEARAVSQLVISTLLLWVPRLPAKPPAALREAYAPMREHLAGTICSMAWPEHCNLPEHCHADQRMATGQLQQCDAAPRNAPAPTSSSYDRGVSCSCSLWQLLTELVTVARAPKHAAWSRGVAGRPATARSGGGGVHAEASVQMRTAAATTNLIASLSEALLLAFDRDPSGGEIGSRVLLSSTLMAIPDASGSNGSSCAGSGNTIGRTKRTRAEAEADVAQAGASVQHHLAEVLIQAVCTATGQLNSTPVAATVLQVVAPGLPSFPAALRKALLNLAEAVASGETNYTKAARNSDEQQRSGEGATKTKKSGDGNAQPFMEIGVSVLIQGCCDADATVRCRSLGHISSCLWRLKELADQDSDANWVETAGESSRSSAERRSDAQTCDTAGGRSQMPESAMTRGSGGGGGGGGGGDGGRIGGGLGGRGDVIRGLLLPVLKGRLLDRTRTCRTRALQLVLELLSLTTVTARLKAGRPATAAPTTTSGPLPLRPRPSRLAYLTARWCLPEVCTLLDASYGSPLYDESNLQLLKQVLVALSDISQPEEVVSMILANPTACQARVAAQGQVAATATTEGEFAVAGMDRMFGGGSKLPAAAAVHIGPGTRRMLASSLTLDADRNGVYNAPVVKPLYDIAVRELTPCDRAEVLAAAIKSAGLPGDERTRRSCLLDSSQSEEAVMRRIGQILGGTALHGALWQQAFRELCVELGEDEEEAATEATEQETEPRQDGDMESCDGKREGKGPKVEDQQQRQRLSISSAAARMARIANALRVLVCLQRHTPQGPHHPTGRADGRASAGADGRQPPSELAATADKDLKSSTCSCDSRDLNARCRAELAIILDAIETSLVEVPAGGPGQQQPASHQQQPRQNRDIEPALQQGEQGCNESPALEFWKVERDACLLWSLRLLEAGLSSPNTDRISSAWAAASRRNGVAPPDQAPTAAAQAKANTLAAVPHLDLGLSEDLGRAVVSYLDRAITRILLYGSFDVVNAAHAVMSQCPGAAPVFHRHLQAAQLAMRQQQQQQQLAVNACCGNGDSCRAQGDGRPERTAATEKTAAPIPSKFSTAGSVVLDITCHSALAKTARYLILLAHMTRLYEYEREDFISRLQDARRGIVVAATTDVLADQGGDCAAPESVGLKASGGKHDGLHGAVTHGMNGLTQQQITRGNRTGDDEDDDYMRESEESRGCREAAQRMLERLMASSAPATHVPVLLAMLPSSQGAPARRHGSGDMDVDGEEDKRSASASSSSKQPLPPLELQVLALRALGRLLVLSPRLTATHGRVVEDLLVGWRSRPVGLVCEALAIAHDLVHRNPSRHRQLVCLIENVIQSALQDWSGLGPETEDLARAGPMSGSGTTRAADQRCALEASIGAAITSEWRNDSRSRSAKALTDGKQDGRKEAVEADNREEVTEGSEEPQACLGLGHPNLAVLQAHRGQEAPLPLRNQRRCGHGDILAALLSAAVGCYCRLQATGRLQWSSGTYRTLAMCLTLARGRVRNHVAQQAAALLLQSTSSASGLSHSKKGGTGVNGRAQGRIPAALALFRNCPGALRIQLVAEALLAVSVPSTSNTSIAIATTINDNVCGIEEGDLLPPLLRPEDFLSDDLALSIIQSVCTGLEEDGDKGVGTSIGAASTMAEGAVVADSAERSISADGGASVGAKGAAAESLLGPSVTGMKVPAPRCSAAAALLLLRQITPSTRTLVAMIPQLQAALRDPWILEGFTPAAVQVLRDLVLRYRPPAGVPAAAAAGAAEAAAGSSGSGAEPHVREDGAVKAPADVGPLASRGGGHAAQRKLLDLLTQIEGRLGVAAGSHRQRTKRAAVSVHENAPAPKDGSERSYERAVLAFASSRPVGKASHARNAEGQVCTATGADGKQTNMRNVTAGGAAAIGAQHRRSTRDSNTCATVTTRKRRTAAQLR